MTIVPTDTVRPAAASLDLSIAVATYGVWFVLVWYGQALPVWLLFLLGGYCTCLHGSLQHSAVHGFPFRSNTLNKALVYPPLAFYFPYSIYREDHLTHHRCDTLTDAETDPESLYLSAKRWNRMNRAQKMFFRFHFTLAGRLLAGPLVSLYYLYKREVVRMRCGDRSRLGIYIVHVAWIAAISMFVTLAAGLPLWKYLLCFAYSGISFTLLRSYTEHRWSLSESERSLIIEGSWLTRLLYLNNNYHWLHHEQPHVHWSKLAGMFRKRRQEILQINGGFYLNGYHNVLSRLWKDKLIDPVHPTFQ